MSRPTLTSPLQIAVVGPGAIGSAFAFQLTRAGHAVTVVARPRSARLAQLTRGGIMTVKGERADVRVLDALDEATAYDLVLVTVLTHQVDSVLPALARSAGRAIQFMANSFEPERLAEAVGPERTSFGMPFIQAHFAADGRLDATIGAGGHKSLMSDARWAAVFNAAGLPARFEPYMKLWLRCHAPMCIAFESVSVAGVRRGGGASWDQAITVARGVIESFALIRDLGFRIYPASKARIAGLPAPVLAAMLWSLSRIRSFRELLATGEAECRALVEVLLAAAPRAESPVRIEKIRALSPSPIDQGV
jgi:2-dehydropantoate 2-reductase